MVWLIVGLILILLFLAAAYYCYRLAFYNPVPRPDDPYAPLVGEQYESYSDRMIGWVSEMDAYPYEAVSIVSRDGLRLAARYYHTADGAPLQIQMHGYRGSGLRDFCGGTKLAIQSGYNVLVVDQRAHGKSGGNTISFGIKERFDCLDWIMYAIQRFGCNTPIILCGMSMGAATVLMTASLPLPENVAGIIADCGYSSPGAIIRKVSADVKIPPAVSYMFMALGAWIFGRFRLWECSAVEAVKHAKIPILLIHGEDDRFVPCEMSRQIFSACSGEKYLETFPDAAHGFSYIIDPKRYERVVGQFVEHCLSQM